MINARLRKRWLMGGFAIASVGEPLDLTYPVERLGAGADTLRELAAGRHPFAERLKSAQKPMLVLGQGAIARPDGAAVLALAREIAERAGLVKEGWNGFNMLHRAAARVGGLDIGFLPGPAGRDIGAILEGAAAGKIEFVYLLGADEIDMNRLGSSFVVYQGHHGDRGAHRADVILPGAAYTEKDATYVNTEGRVQQARRAVSPPGEAREDWAILRAFSEQLGMRLAYDSLEQLRKRLYEQVPHLAALDAIEPVSWGPFGETGSTDAAPLRLPVANYYMTDPISRASETMAACTEAFLGGARKTGTHG
jgi:NADH-quinone oxidoreductase subunit G